MVKVKFFEAVTTYGEWNSAAGYYWKFGGSDWVGPFADVEAALRDWRGE